MTLAAVYSYRGRVMAVAPFNEAPVPTEYNSVWIAVTSLRPLSPEEASKAVAARALVIATQQEFWEDYRPDQWTEHELKILNLIANWPGSLRVVTTEDVS